MARGMGRVRATADTVARTHPIPQSIHLYSAALPRRGPRNWPSVVRPHACPSAARSSFDDRPPLRHCDVYRFEPSSGWVRRLKATSSPVGLMTLTPPGEDYR